MAVTVKQVFERAMHISDNGEENSLETLTTDNQEYKYRTLSILNTLIGELLPYSDTVEFTASTRPTFTFLTNIDFSEEIPLDDYCAGTVLPYGLVAHLFVDENPTLASFAEQRYEELLNRLMKGVGKSAVSEDIEDVYGPKYLDSDGNVQTINTGTFGFNWISRW